MQERTSRGIPLDLGASSSKGVNAAGGWDALEEMERGAIMERFAPSLVIPCLCKWTKYRRKKTADKYQQKKPQLSLFLLFNASRLPRQTLVQFYAVQCFDVNHARDDS